MPLNPTVSVLVVDDLTMMRRIIEAILGRLGFAQVDMAPDGASALAMMRKAAYGLVISDLDMQPMNGLHLLRAVRADAALQRTPFILTTASMAGENIIAARHAGVDAYLLKPFTPEALKAKIEAVL